jgi:hypothetical protein
MNCPDPHRSIIPLYIQYRRKRNLLRLFLILDRRVISFVVDDERFLFDRSLSHSLPSIEIRSRPRFYSMSQMYIKS